MSIFSRRKGKKRKPKKRHEGKHEKRHAHEERAKKPEPEKKAEPEKHAEKPGEKPAEGKEGEKKPEDKKKKPSRRVFPRVKIIPKFYENWVEKQLYLSGSTRDKTKFIRTIIVISLIVSIAAGALFRRYMMFIVPGTFVVMLGFFSAVLILSVDRRGRFVDEILPDALMLLSANIRAGYIPSRALILSARKEFGPLSEAIKLAGKEIMSGKPLDEGLRDVPSTIKSADLKRTIELIIQGIRGGGQLVALLEENAMDIRRRQAIKKEIKANTMMYAIFIAFAGCLGAPGLYALSSYLTNTMSELGPDMSMSSEISSKVSFISLEGSTIDPQFLFQFSIAAILITTVFGGMILGLISSGKEKEGLKFAPVLSIVALLVFLGATFLINTMFATMLPS